GDGGEIGSDQPSFIAETMAERALGSVESGSAVFERTVAERLSEIEVGELPVFNEMECGSGLKSGCAVPPHSGPPPKGEGALAAAQTCCTVPREPGPLPRGEGGFFWRVLPKCGRFNICEVLSEIGRNGSEEVVSNAFQNRIVVACALFLFGISQCAEPCLALRRCPFGPHIAK